MAVQSIFDDARLLDQVAYDLILGDFQRAQNRTAIQRLANGSPPMSDEDAKKSGVAINVNKLTLTRVCHESRAQFANSLMTGGRYFMLQTDAGAMTKRSERNAIVTAEANRPLKKSIVYFETLRAKIGQLILHGISPSVWESESKIIPKPLDVADALIPGGTLLGFENLPFVFFRRSFTAIELLKMTDRVHRDPGWNMPYVRKCLHWLNDQLTDLISTNWPESWSPEKWEEMDKEGGGLSYCDRAPTLDCFDVYGYVEGTRGQKPGWVRRIILDSWSNPAMDGGKISATRLNRVSGKDFPIDKPDKDNFLYSSGDRRVYDTWQSVVSFQFADLSAVFPARYHAVRGLGYLLYAPCHLENRMWCKFQEAVFEALLQYFKVKNMSDAQRALKLELANMGILDETLMPVPANERWQPNAQFIQLGRQDLEGTIAESAKSWTQNLNTTQNRTEKTKFQVMAEVQAANALVSAAMQQFHAYQDHEYREIVRRLMSPDSKDAMARTFRANCLRGGVPESMLKPECWNVESVKVVGGGNQTLQLLKLEEQLKLMPALDPQPRRQLLRDAFEVFTESPSKAMERVPDAPEVSDSITFAEQSWGTLMRGVMVTPRSGLNADEVAAKTIILIHGTVEQIKKQGGVGTPQDLLGLNTACVFSQKFIDTLKPDPEKKAIVKQLQDALTKEENELRAMAQRQQLMAKKARAQGNGNGGLDPKDKAKIAATLLTAQTKSKLAQQSHAQRTMQRDIQFRQQLEHEQMQHRADMAGKDLETAANIQRDNMTGFGGDDEGGG